MVDIRLSIVKARTNCVDARMTTSDVGVEKVGAIYLAIHMNEAARQRPRDLWSTEEFKYAQRQRKKVEALFAELKSRTHIGLQRLRLRRLKFYQKVRAVDTFHRYLWERRQQAVTSFNEGPESGADYVLAHIKGAIEQTKESSESRSYEEDLLDIQTISVARSSEAADRVSTPKHPGIPANRFARCFRKTGAMPTLQDL